MSDYWITLGLLTFYSAAAVIITFSFANGQRHDIRREVSTLCAEGRRAVAAAALRDAAVRYDTSETLFDLDRLAKNRPVGVDTPVLVLWLEEQARLIEEDAL